MRIEEGHRIVQQNSRAGDHHPGPKCVVDRLSHRDHVPVAIRGGDMGGGSGFH